MQFSEQWLRSWVNPSMTTDELSYLLTMSGLEVEEVVAAAPPFNGVVIAEVKEVYKHENADRLRVTKVDAGLGELVQIVCGAPNVAVGLKVPCALPGALLPGDFKIKTSKMRGVESNGMLCSGKEIGVPDDADGLLVLPADAPIGENIRDYLALNDQLFALKITPNRADCLSIRGIAREVAALTGAELAPVALKAAEIQISDSLPVSIEAVQGCGRYLGRVLRHVNAAAPTPAWMKQRLERAGLRSISAIVDITNYVLLEQGQPMHAFDLAKLDGGIVVRMARDGEELLCLNEKMVRLNTSQMVIADSSKVLALAGIMGGEESGVTTSSTDIFLESAFFAPLAIAGKARELGFSSDSSFRYERGVDFQLQYEGMERATALVLEICGGQAGPVVEQIAKLPVRPAVCLRTARVSKVLGINFSGQQVADILTRLGLQYQLAAEVFTVQVPSFRFDIEIEEDLIEEVARVYGYDNIPAEAPRSTLRMLAQPENLRSRDQIRHLLADRDYQEVLTYAFVDEAWERDFAANDQAIRLINPIAAHMAVMRSTLIGGLLDVLVSNLNRKQVRVRIFEVARVFHQSAEWFAQPEKVAGLTWGHRCAEQWAEPAEQIDFFDAKADVEALLHPYKANYRPAAHPACHPGRCAEVVLNDQVIGIVGELHPKWVQQYDLSTAPVLFELDLAALQNRQLIQAKTVSKFQAVRRDLALLIDETVSVADLLANFAKHRTDIVLDVALFDVYRGKGVPEGKKSLAFAVLLQHNGRTLTDEDTQAAINALLAGVTELGAQLRN
ncbi:phenylalanine--tRNA ligase subunit beta [Neisseriaceae bacterium TC5R-5]|nr:phenylalanine--tRNA ligase subunit beta [Neisseriaceae bacterium TC5R-5]